LNDFEIHWDGRYGLFSVYCGGAALCDFQSLVSALAFCRVRNPHRHVVVTGA
jgi:hypothetical protein